jgi:hypothetical protein
MIEEQVKIKQDIQKLIEETLESATELGCGIEDTATLIRCKLHLKGFLVGGFI